MSAFKSVHPVGKQIVKQVDDRADAPGQRIGPEYILYLAGHSHDDQDVADPQDAPDGEHDNHRHEGLSGAAAYGGYGMGERQQEVEQRHDVRLGYAVPDHAGGGVERADQIWGKYIVHNTDGFRDQDSGKDRKAGSFFRPVVLSCPQVLADKGGRRHVEACDRQKGKALDLAVDAVSRHGESAEGVDLGLYDDVGEGDYRILYAGGQAVAYHLEKDISVKADLFQFHCEKIALPQQIYHTKDYTCRLGDDRRHGGRPDAPPESADEEKV